MTDPQPTGQDAPTRAEHPNVTLVNEAHERLERGDTCPIYPGQSYLDWDLPDPAGLPLEGVRPIRDEIARRVRQLLTELT